MLKRLAAVCAAALALVAAAPAATAQPVKTVPHQGCAEHYLVAVPGGANTAEGIPDWMPHGGNVFMTGILTRLGTDGHIQPLWVAYPSTPFATTEYQRSSAGGYQRVRRTVVKLANQCPAARFSFTGYSLGADIAARMTSDIANGRGPIPPEKVSGVALFANPYQGGNGAVLSAGTSPDSRGALGSLPGGYGVLGNRVLEICNPEDIVCSTKDSMRGLVSPALRTNVAAGRVPLNEFASVFRTLGLASYGVLHDMGAHGDYSLAQQQEATNWIIERSEAPVQIPVELGHE